MLWVELAKLAIAPAFVAIVTLVGRGVGASVAGFLAEGGDHVVTEQHETELVWQQLGHLQTREVGQVLERAVRRIDKHPPAGPQWRASSPG